MGCFSSNCCSFFYLVFAGVISVAIVVGDFYFINADGGSDSAECKDIQIVFNKALSKDTKNIVPFSFVCCFCLAAIFLLLQIVFLIFHEGILGDCNICKEFEEKLLFFSSTIFYKSTIECQIGLSPGKSKFTIILVIFIERLSTLTAYLIFFHCLEYESRCRALVFLCPVTVMFILTAFWWLCYIIYTWVCILTDYGAYQPIDLTWFAGEIVVSAVIGLAFGAVNFAIAKWEESKSKQAQQSENLFAGHSELQSRPPRSESML